MVAASRLLLSAASAVSAMAEAQAVPVLRSLGHGEPSFALRTVGVAVHRLHLRDEPKSTMTNQKWLYQAIAQCLSNGTASHLRTGREQTIIWTLYHFYFRCFEKLPLPQLICKTERFKRCAVMLMASNLELTGT